MNYFFIFCFLALLVMNIIGLTMSFVINTVRTRRTRDIESGSEKTLPNFENKFVVKQWISNIIGGIEKLMIAKTSYIPSHSVRNLLYKYAFRINMSDIFSL